MITNTRRTFLGGLGGGMVAVGLGSALPGRAALALGLDRDDLSFGELEPLVALMQETPPAKLQSVLIGKLAAGTELRTLVAAGALANARTFGGHDYTGYHCMMALVPAYEMSELLPGKQAALPVLKVLYRTATRIQEKGGRSREALHALPAPAGTSREDAVRRLRAAVVDRDVEAAERAFGELSTGSTSDAYNDLQSILQENLDVHRVVLAWRAWETLELTGEQHARTLMRQSVRFCVDAEKARVDRGRPTPELRSLLPALIDDCGLERKELGGRAMSDAELDELAQVVFECGKADAARAVAEALSGGASAEDVGEALSLASNRLLLHDPGRKNSDDPTKPKGSVHGASVGVHASDAARAWRNIAGVSNHRNTVASLIAGAYHTAGQSKYVGRDPFPYRRHLEGIEGEDAKSLLAGTRAAIEKGDQERAAAFAQCYGDLGCPERPLFDLLLEYAVSEDGALHAEKYYGTVREEFAAARPAFRWRHAVALARVTASEHGWPAPGLRDARERLGV